MKKRLGPLIKDVEKDIDLVTQDIPSDKYTFDYKVFKDWEEVFFKLMGKYGS